MDIRSHYYKCDNDISDKLASTQSLAEQSVYRRLYRLSYGFKKNTCRVGMGALADSCNIVSRNTVKKAISGLVEKKHIEILDEANNNSAGTEYRVFRPSEIATVSKIDIVKPESVRSAVSKNDIAAVSKNAVAKIDTVEESAAEQKMANVVTMGINAPRTISKNDTAKSTVSKNAVAKIDPIKHIRHLKDTRSPDPVKYFYKCLGHEKTTYQQRGKGGTVLRRLKKDGFSDEEIRYAIDWTTTPGNTKEKAYDFSIIPHTIGEAVTAMYAEQETVQKEREESDRVTAAEEERRRLEGEIEEMRSRMTEKELADLREKALEEIRNTNGIKEQFVNEPLINAKENEMLRERNTNT